MEKKLVLLLFIIIFAFPLTVQAAYPPQGISVAIDGELIQFSDQGPYIKNDRTMVPLRVPMEKMGCSVEWDSGKQQAIVKKDGQAAVFTIGSRTYTVNNEKKIMDVAAELKGDRTAFPIRFAAEAMGAEVEWDQVSLTVHMFSKEMDKQQIIEQVSDTILQPGVKTAELTDRDIKRLQGYPLSWKDDVLKYPWGQHPERWKEEIKYTVPWEEPQKYTRDLLQEYLDRFMQNAFKPEVPGQRLLLSPELIGEVDFAYKPIRGVLQTPVTGGCIEQDVEIRDGSGLSMDTGEMVYSYGTRNLGSPRFVK